MKDNQIRFIKAVSLLLLGFVAGVAATILNWNLYVMLEGRRLDRELTAKSPEQRHYEFSPKGRFTKAESELRTASGDYHRWLAMTDAAFWAVDVGEAVKAETYANELLRLAPQFRKDWNFGNALHKANLTLGRLALRRSDLSAARTYLLKAADIPGSPQLNSFGPNMLLAKEMFERGERESLIPYFEACGRFWSTHDDELREWSALVEAGVLPQFGANLDY